MPDRDEKASLSSLAVSSPLAGRHLAEQTIHPKRFRDVRVVGRANLLDPLGEVERLLLVTAVLQIELGQVVRCVLQFR